LAKIAQFAGAFCVLLGQAIYHYDIGGLGRADLPWEQQMGPPWFQLTF